jgi:SAM-dependent methyltransferase/ribosomal protein S18 acetylase RimI-like enzyme
MQAGGVRGLWFAALAKLGYRRLTVREHSLKHPAPPIATKIAVDISRLEEREIDEYNAFRCPSDRGSALRRLRNGDTCFVARHEGVIICACWGSTNDPWSVYLSSVIRLSSDEACSYDLYTSPEWRGNGIPAAVTSELHRFYRNAGKRRVVALTVPDNRPAMTDSIGYRTVGTLGYVGVGRFRHFFNRMHPGERAPGEEKSSVGWDRSFDALDACGHYLDDFLAGLKRRAYLDLITKWGGAPAEGKVLKTDLFEEAMGPDSFLLEMPSSRATLIGMDVSSAATSRASQRDAASRATYVCADTRHLPFADGSIAMIVSPSTLDHFSDPADIGRSLRELRRVLAQDGRIIITLDNRGNVFDPLLRIVSHLGMIPYFLGQSYTIGELRTHLEAASFDVIEETAIIHHPRLTAVAAVTVARRIGWAPLTRLVQATLLSMQRLQNTRWQYLTGCFVAALAVPRSAKVSTATLPAEAVSRAS